ncbi:CBS domain-containing protein [Nitrospira sp. NS4]|uniref:CBS domain-containing protein n=1 Tax=Nitrospira sp. NS4 TaxID=3414498 RepID=UPI003C2D64A4
MEIVTTHRNADFDGLASMVAARKLYPDVRLVLSGGAQETVHAFITAHDLNLTKLKEIDISKVRRLILVDTHEPERIGPFKQCWQDQRVEIQVFDHHGEREDLAHARPAGGPVTAVIERVGATTTILIERVRQSGAPLTVLEATVLALGLYEETGSFTFASTTPRDLEAAAFLITAGADLNLVSQTLRRPLDPDVVALLNDLLEHSEVHYLEGRKVLVATSTVDRCQAEAAEAVHKLAELEGVDAVLAVVMTEEHVEVIGRSRTPDIDVGGIAKEFGGGGHAVAAAAIVKGRPLAEVKERVVQLLTQRYRPTLLAKDVMTRPVKSVGADATVKDTEEQMTHYGVNVLPVLDGKDRYVGLVSREQIQKALFHRLGALTARDIMHTDHYTAAPATSFHEIEQIMLERNQRFVPILDGPRVVGVITRTDLLRTWHDDVLRTVRIRPKLSEPAETTRPMHRRNLSQQLRERLPAPLFKLLKEAGLLADRLDLSLYVVGGFVRDLLLGIDNLDLDLVVEGDGIAFARKLAAEHRGRVKAHERFGTAVVVLPDGVKLDVATARTEYYEFPTALPTVEQSSIKKDLYRRDFTINALAVRLNGRGFGDVLDFYGGQRDLKDKAVRVLHSLSFIEDPTRVFRAIRFETRFGFHLGKDTLALIKAAVKMELFHRLSGHRLLEELKALCSEREPKTALKRMAELDLLRFIHPKLVWTARLEKMLLATEEALDWYRLLYLGRRMEGWLVYVMALAAVLPDRGMAEWLKRFPFSEREATTLKAFRGGAHRALRQLAKQPPLKPSAVVRLLQDMPDEALVAMMAQSSSDQVKRQVSAFLTSYQHVKPVLTGVELKAMGLKPGPQFKKILDRLLDARLNGEVKSESDEQELVERLTKQ